MDDLQTNIDPWLGTEFDGRYRLCQKLGEGGMGVVYKAEHILIEKPVAIKILRTEFAKKDDLVKRFQQEARSASKIRHEHIVDITDYGKTPDGSAYFVMEYLEGVDLAGVIEKGRLPYQRAIPIVGQVCSALAAAHSAGIIHRDLKPENIFLSSQHEFPDFVKILDFGIAKISSLDADAGGRLTKTGMIFGTPEYMSPEQAGGTNLDYRVDIYAVGVILFEVLTGNVPYRDTSFMGVLRQHMMAPIPSARSKCGEVPAAVEAVIQKAMAKEPAERFQSMVELWSALDATVPEATRSRRIRFDSAPPSGERPEARVADSKRLRALSPPRGNDATTDVPTASGGERGRVMSPPPEPSGQRRFSPVPTQERSPSGVVGRPPSSPPSLRMPPLRTGGHGVVKPVERPSGALPKFSSPPSGGYRAAPVARPSLPSGGYRSVPSGAYSVSKGKTPPPATHEIDSNTFDSATDAPTGIAQTMLLADRLSAKRPEDLGLAAGEAELLTGEDEDAPTNIGDIALLEATIDLEQFAARRAELEDSQDMATRMVGAPPELQNIREASTRIAEQPSPTTRELQEASTRIAENPTSVAHAKPANAGPRTVSAKPLVTGPRAVVANGGPRAVQPKPGTGGQRAVEVRPSSGPQRLVQPAQDPRAPQRPDSLIEEMPTRIASNPATGGYAMASPPPIVPQPMAPPPQAPPPRPQALSPVPQSMARPDAAVGPELPPAPIPAFTPVPDSPTPPPKIDVSAAQLVPPEQTPRRGLRILLAVMLTLFLTGGGVALYQFVLAPKLLAAAPATPSAPAAPPPGAGATNAATPSGVPPTPPSAPPAAPASEEKNFTVTVRAAPPEAELFQGKTSLGSPGVITLRGKEGDRVKLTAKAEGYKTGTIEIVLGATAEENITLEKKPTAPPEVKRPDTRPDPKPDKRPDPKPDKKPDPKPDKKPDKGGGIVNPFD